MRIRRQEATVGSDEQVAQVAKMLTCADNTWWENLDLSGSGRGDSGGEERVQVIVDHELYLSMNVARLCPLFVADRCRNAGVWWEVYKTEVLLEEIMRISARGADEGTWHAVIGSYFLNLSKGLDGSSHLVRLSGTSEAGSVAL